MENFLHDDASGLAVTVSQPTEVHAIERPQPPDFFFMVRDFVGWKLQEQMKELPTAHWVKTDYTAPAFENLVFAYKNQVFCVLIVMVHRKKGEAVSIGAKKENLLREAKENNLREAKENNLIPCLYRVYVENFSNPSPQSLKPLVEGWNLIHVPQAQKSIPLFWPMTNPWHCRPGNCMSLPSRWSGNIWSNSPSIKFCPIRQCRR